MTVFGNEPTSLDLRIQNKLDEATLVNNKNNNIIHFPILNINKII
jgi:hypothetical protein